MKKYCILRFILVVVVLSFIGCIKVYNNTPNQNNVMWEISYQIDTTEYYSVLKGTFYSYYSIYSNRDTNTLAVYYDDCYNSTLLLVKTKGIIEVLYFRPLKTDNK